MSVVSFPRRVETGRPSVRDIPTRKTRKHQTRAPRGLVVTTRWRRASTTRKSAIVVLMALTLSLVGTMVEANRQIEIHTMQSQLLQEQSTYAVQVGTMINRSAPSQIATEAGVLHLVNPTSVTQVPSTPLDAPLPVPKFSGYAPVTSRTKR